jgi:hypothetical protein
METKAFVGLILLKLVKIEPKFCLIITCCFTLIAGVTFLVTSGMTFGVTSGVKFVVAGVFSGSMSGEFGMTWGIVGKTTLNSKTF